MPWWLALFIAPFSLLGVMPYLLRAGLFLLLQAIGRIIDRDVARRRRVDVKLPPGRLDGIC